MRAGIGSPERKRTRTRSARSTTWKLVTMRPAWSQTKPEAGAAAELAAATDRHAGRSLSVKMNMTEGELRLNRSIDVISNAARSPRGAGLRARVTPQSAPGPRNRWPIHNVAAINAQVDREAPESVAHRSFKSPVSGSPAGDPALTGIDAISRLSTAALDPGLDPVQFVTSAHDRPGDALCRSGAPRPDPPGRAAECRAADRRRLLDIWKVELPSGPIAVKRALAKLKVAQDWRAPVGRSRYEIRWFRAVARIIPEAVLVIVAADEEAGVRGEHLDLAFIAGVDFRTARRDRNSG